ncbi:class I SAM-dependent methyltransferase family protein [Streptomyces sp. DSM 44917]|uniref:Class I SAM-dependent methyltransferase family protein n=1 Tax=Streptomyces boetiae TaxID=3075541 RepID=A0ABU2L4W5_9ACTN|nr:class I SAM-dependent methyltransferase family protein [Streptomyces sp. DSM 44917]MDT0306358.1 class I SAM-dependent methyltransferase family protein [Streptomyces sp. DSM 44917]
MNRPAKAVNDPAGVARRARPLPLAFADRVGRALLRGLLRTVGRTSQGIRTGLRHGFDSGPALDHVYLDRARGSLGIGRLIDRAYLDAPGCRAVRARALLLRRTLHEEIARRRPTDPENPVRILDVAAGTGRYLQDLLADHPHDAVEVICRDVAVLGLAQGRAEARKRGLTRIVYERGDAFDPEPPAHAPDVILVAGLYELVLDEDLIRASLARLRGLLAPGGALIFTIRTRHPRRDPIAGALRERDGGPGPTRCRPAAQVAAWARRAGFREVTQDREEVGLFTVTTAR